jgi:hypothetical protein
VVLVLRSHRRAVPNPVNSMMPTLLTVISSGQQIRLRRAPISNKFVALRTKRGDVVFRPPHHRPGLVKRVVGAATDRLPDQVTVNGGCWLNRSGPTRAPAMAPEAARRLREQLRPSPPRRARRPAVLDPGEGMPAVAIS